MPAKALLLALKYKHPNTYKHCKAVALLSIAIGKEYISKYGGKLNIHKIQIAALFHDIGKLFISENTLRKKNLSKSEWEEIKEHPEEGAYLTKYVLDPTIRKSIITHQEEVDGSGYPKGLDDENLNIAAKIISVADDFCAMTEKRGYNVAKTFSEAINEIYKDSGKRYDERMAKAFIRVFEKRNMIKPLKR